MDIATHYDLVVIVTVSGALQVSVLLALGIAFRRRFAQLHRETLECQRLTRQVAGLVAQETGKLRALIRERT